MMSSSQKDSDTAFFDSLHRDCREFRHDQPCRPHKERGVVCADCTEYDPAPYRICIVKLGSVGDVLRTTGLLPGLRRKYPRSRVHWLTRPEAGVLLESNPWIEELFVTERGELPAVLGRLAHDLVICPDADLESVALADGIRLAPEGRRLGFALDSEGHVEPLSEAARRWYLMGISDDRKKTNEHSYPELVGEIFELRATAADRPILELGSEEIEQASTWLSSRLADDWRPGRDGVLVGLNTGAGRRWPLKQWTLEGQVGLIRRLAEHGHRVLLLGGPYEVERHRALLAAAPDGVCIDSGNDNTLRVFSARLSLCPVLVTGDTMALHIGTAMGKRIVALFGPTSPAEIELHGNGTKLWTTELDCLCCYSNCHKSPNCMDLISVDMVWEALQPHLAAVQGA